jgi:hypothetical protein
MIWSMTFKWASKQANHGILSSANVKRSYASVNVTLPLLINPG